MKSQQLRYFETEFVGCALAEADRARKLSLQLIHALCKSGNKVDLKLIRESLENNFNLSNEGVLDQNLSAESLVILYYASLKQWVSIQSSIGIQSKLFSI